MVLGVPQTPHPSLGQRRVARLARVARVVEVVLVLVVVVGLDLEVRRGRVSFNRLKLSPKARNRPVGAWTTCAGVEVDLPLRMRSMRRATHARG
jgi:hypothetical protein